MIREWNEESLDHRNALLYAMGISEEDAKRPVIGLVNSWNEMNPGLDNVQRHYFLVMLGQRHLQKRVHSLKPVDNLLVLK